MKKFNLFKTLPEGFRLATLEDIPLVSLTLAQAFTDYKYPIPSVEISYSAAFKYNYEISKTCALNALKNGAILTNEDYSAVLLTTPYNLRADYGVDSLYENLKTNAGILAAENLIKVFDYICKEEELLHMNDDDVFVDMFAVQTPRQGQKLGSKLMRELFRQCEIAHKNVFLYTNTEKNNSIYNHLGFETIKSIHNKELNSDTFYLYWKCSK